MKCIVTGAAGFIGSNLAHRLAREGRPLLLVDHELTAAKCPNFAALARFAFSRHDHFLDDLRADRIRQPLTRGVGAAQSAEITGRAPRARG